MQKLPGGIETVTMDEFDEAVDVLCQAFYDYPVMKYLAANAGDDYDRQLRLLVGFFSRARHLRGDLVWAIRSEGRIVGVANIVRPDTKGNSELDSAREQLWTELGDEARMRYEAFGEATAQFSITDPHYHLPMIGVLPECGGQGVGRRLLDGLHELSADDPGSSGVTLTTEHPDNVSLYQYFGYEIVGSTKIGDFESWTFFRRDS